MKNFNEVRERVEKLNIIDDTLFQKMAESIGFCEEMISTVINEEVEITQVIPQNTIKNLQGRSVIVDALCEKKDGTFINVEVQKGDNDNHQKRVRYNASCITANTTNADAYNYEKFPKTSVRKAHFKKNEEGVGMMCDIVEEYAKEQSERAVKEAEAKMAKKLLDEGMSVEKIVSIMEMLTMEDISRLAQK